MCKQNPPAHFVKPFGKCLVLAFALLLLLACGGPDLGVKRAALNTSKQSTTLEYRMFGDADWELVGALVAPSAPGAAMPVVGVRYNITCVWRKAATYYSKINAFCHFPSSGHLYKVMQSAISTRVLANETRESTENAALSSAMRLLGLANAATPLTRKYRYHSPEEQGLADADCRATPPLAAGQATLGAGDRCSVEELEVFEEPRKGRYPRLYIIPKDRPNPELVSPIWATNRASSDRPSAWSCLPPTDYNSDGIPGKPFTPNAECQNP